MFRLNSISGKRSFVVGFGGAHTTYSLPIFTVVCQVLRGLDRRLLVHCTARHFGQTWFFKVKIRPFQGRILFQSGPADNRFLTWQSHSAGCQFWLICRLMLATPCQETLPNCFSFSSSSSPNYHHHQQLFCFVFSVTCVGSGGWLVGMFQAALGW